MSNSTVLIRGSGKEELMKRAIMGVSAAAAIALAPICIPPAQGHADDPCVSITDPAAHQACIDESLRDTPLPRYQCECQSSPFTDRWANFGGVDTPNQNAQVVKPRSGSTRPGQPMKPNYPID